MRHITSIRQILTLHAAGGLALRANAAHAQAESASDWYDSYGEHISTDAAGDVCIQAVDYDWLDEEDDETVLDEHRDELPDDITTDEALMLISRARSVREAAEQIEGLLEAAIDAAGAGDLDEVIRILERASDAETEHGDDPATMDVARALLREEHQAE